MHKSLKAIQKRHTHIGNEFEFLFVIEPAMNWFNMIQLKISDHLFKRVSNTIGHHFFIPMFLQMIKSKRGTHNKLIFMLLKFTVDKARAYSLAFRLWNMDKCITVAFNIWFPFQIISWFEYHRNHEPKPIDPEVWNKFDAFETEFFKVDSKYYTFPTI